MSNGKTLNFDRERLRFAESSRESKLKYKEALRHVARLEDELQAALEIKKAKASIKIHPSKTTGKTEGAQATAVVLLSDWHVEEVVNPKKVNGLNKYNPEIAARRAEQCFQRILRLVKKEQQDCHIETILLWLGGDFITNSLRDENLENNAMQPVEAALYAKSLLRGGLEFLCNNWKGKIVCVCSSGNHARITDKIHIATEYGNSLETFIYAALSKEFPTIEWVIEEGYNTYIEVMGYTCRLNHGHFVRYQGGIGGLTIPLIKAIKGWDSQKRSDYTFIG